MLHSISEIRHQKIRAATFTHQTALNKEGERFLWDGEGGTTSSSNWEEGTMQCWVPGSREHTAGTSAGITNGSRDSIVIALTVWGNKLTN